MAEKGSMRERHLCATFKLRTNSFRQKRARLEVLIKVTSKADRWKESKKSFIKKTIFYCIFFFNNVTLIKTSHPALCRQIKFVLNLKVVHKRRSLIDPFPANHCPLPPLSILMIPLDKCQIKSFNDNNILIKVELFCLKNLLLLEKEL